MMTTIEAAGLRKNLKFCIVRVNKLDRDHVKRVVASEKLRDKAIGPLMLEIRRLQRRLDRERVSG